MDFSHHILPKGAASKCGFAVILAAAALSCRSLKAQVAYPTAVYPTAVVDAVSDEPGNSATQGFAVVKADSKTVELIEDFDRYASKKSWELAFRTLTSIEEAKSRGMVPTGDGFFVPIRARIKQSLLRLPPEGREAYRLFNDAVAKQLWDNVKNPKPGAANDELPTLRKLVDRYFLTSVGDLAADRLGDALFEQGDFAAAEAMWRMIIEKYPDGHLSPAKLQAKRCVALSRLGRREALAALTTQVAEQYADQKVTIGGREVGVVDFVRSLLSKEAAAAPANSAEAEAILLPTTEEPIWQIHLMGLSPTGQVDPQTGMPMTTPFRAAPTGAADDKRFYANWLGIVYAADLQTGKMLWRTGKFGEGAQQAMNYLQQGMSAENFFLTAADGKLFVMRQPTKNIIGQLLGGDDQQQDGQLALECLDAASGTTLWSARKLGAAVISAPYLLDGVAYVAGISSNNSTMVLLAVDTTSGRLLWKADLGTPQNTNNNRGGYDFGGPKMLALGGTLFVATNNGILLAVGLASHRIEWALQHETRAINNNNQQRIFFNGSSVVPLESPGSLFDVDGVFYLKDASSRLLYALDPSGPSVKWKRPISAEETVAVIDGPIAYLLGTELSALDLRSRKLLWSTKLPGECAMLRPLVCPEHVYVPTARGIFDIDPANGDIRRVFRGADRESGGGQLLLAGDKLISITDTAVTAYPIQRAKPPKITSQTLHE